MKKTDCRRAIWLLLAVGLVCGCGEKGKQEQKAPTRVKTQIVSPGFVDNAQT